MQIFHDNFEFASDQIHENKVLANYSELAVLQKSSSLPFIFDLYPVEM